MMIYLCFAPFTFILETSQNARSMQPHQPRAKWSPSSLQLKSSPDLNQRQKNRRRQDSKRELQSSDKNIPPVDKNISPALISEFPAKTEVIMQEQDGQQEMELNDEWNPEFDDVSKDDVRLKDRSRMQRSRSAQYKTRGSVVQKLHCEEQQDYKKKAVQTKPTPKQKTQLPRMKEKPRMDVYIPSVVTVGTLARILDVKFSASKSLFAHCSSSLNNS